MRFLTATVASISLLGLASFAHSTQLDYFIAYNKTDHVVKIAVGNFVPTGYTLKPHTSTYIYVSTDNQNISIESII